MLESSRRRFLLTSLAAPAALLWTRAAGAAEATTEPAPTPVPESFPSQDPALVREMVGVSHGNVARVRELLAQRPTLANATWDWGFGDWESALGAASHVGNREIAELLLAHGARPTLFSATMLGQLEVVRAFVEAAPGCQRTPGPHGITLLSHARAGQERAAAVARYLETLGDADLRPATVPLPAEQATLLAGSYSFGPRDADRIVITFEKNDLRFSRVGGAPRGLLHLGQQGFHPVGAPAVRIRFEIESGRVAALTVHDPDLVLTARRTI